MDRLFKIDLLFGKYNKNSIQKIMSWSRGHLSLTENLATPAIEICINCGEEDEAQARITMEFGEGNYNTGPICRRCYSSCKGPKITEF